MGIEGSDLKDITVQLPIGRERTLITNALIAVDSPAAAMACTIGQLQRLGLSGRQRALIGRNVEENPVHPRPCRDIRVINDQGETTRPRGSACPAQGGREIETVGSVDGGDEIAIVKGR